MGIAETLLIYGLIGVVVAAAMRANLAGTWGMRSITNMTAWMVLWPLFAPVLLGKPVTHHAAQVHPQPEPAVTPHVHAAQQRLVTSIKSLEGLAEDVITPQLDQIDAMMQSLATADKRLQEMDELLQTHEFNVAHVDAALRELRTSGYDEEEPRVRSLQARRKNIERLQTMRDRTREELERALVKIEEMSSQVMLLRFADQPAAQLADCLQHVADDVADIASAVLEMSEL